MTFLRRFLFYFIGVSLGVAIYVAMRIANIEIMRSFEISASAHASNKTKRPMSINFNPLHQASSVSFIFKMP